MITIDDIREHYNSSYRFLLSIVEDMRKYNWEKESCLNIIDDVIHSQIKLNNEYVNSSRSDIKCL